jgi:hypothetical protein
MSGMAAFFWDFLLFAGGAAVLLALGLLLCQVHRFPPRVVVVVCLFAHKRSARAREADRFVFFVVAVIASLRQHAGEYARGDQE